MSQIHDNLPHVDLPELPRGLYRADQVHELDRIAIEEEGIPGLELMERAGSAAFVQLRHRMPRGKRLGVLCGAGNNGGDGFVAARLAHEAGYEVTVWQLGECELGNTAATAREAMEACGLHAKLFEPDAFSTQDILVDGLFGTGLHDEVKGPWLEAINAVNAAHEQGAFVLSLDIPSGLHADTGCVLGVAVEADCCVTFIGLKVGLFTGRGPDLCGAIVFHDLGVPAGVYDRVPLAAIRLSFSGLKHTLPTRRPSAHKGDFGHVLAVGGEQGMSGAIRLTGEAAARVGAGKVSVATRKGHAAIISGAVPELMCSGVEDGPSLRLALETASVIALGPGLGQGPWGQSLFEALRESQIPMVVDADALNLLAKNPLKKASWILTPHPGEAARLLGVGVEDINVNRIASAKKIQNTFGGVVVLKGVGTVVVDAQGEVGICSDGNPGMASGGMGDVLTGVIAGLLAQGWLPGQAAQLGVCLHARAGDLVASEGQRGLMASDLLPVLRRLLD